MWALKVTRSTIAATRRGSLKTDPHSLKGRLVPTPAGAFLAFGDDLEEQLGAAGIDLDVAEFIEQQQIQPAVAAHDAGEHSPVGGLDEFIDQRGAGDVTDSAALFAGGQTQADEQVGLAGAAVTEQHDRLARVDPGAGGQRGQLRGRDARHGVEVELAQPLQPREARFGDSAGAAPLAAFVDLGGEHLGEEAEVGVPFPQRDLGQTLRLVAHGGQVQFPRCRADGGLSGGVASGADVPAPVSRSS